MIAEKIELEDVRSSNISALGYNVAKNIAALRFKNGDIWHYAGVQRDVFNAWYFATSIGKFYTEQIRGKYQAEKMTGACPDCGARGWIGDTCEDCGCRAYVADPRPERKGANDGAAGSL